MHRVVVHDVANGFLERAEAWLLQREDLNNLILSLAYARASSPDGPGDAMFATVEAGDEVVGCAVRTPPNKVLVTDLPLAAAPAVARAVSSRYDAIPAVLGPEPVADAVAAAWVERRGGSPRPGMRQRIYRLDEVRPPAGVAGRLRLATPRDVELAVTWGRGFAEDAGAQFAVERDSVVRWITRGDLHFWEAHGVPRSVALASGRTPRGVRVGYVYTPPEQRRSGYASACVAALSRRLLDDGYDFCVLYTDLGNPTSNAIYRRLGYEPIGDVRDIEIVPPSGEG